MTTERGLRAVAAVILEPDVQVAPTVVLADLPPPTVERAPRRVLVGARQVAAGVGQVVQGAGVFACGVLVAVAAGLLGALG
jgi:hypothetical protein